MMDGQPAWKSIGGISSGNAILASFRADIMIGSRLRFSRFM